jgi:3-oxoadipate enol-lactonase
MSDLSYFSAGDGVRLAYRLDGSADAPLLVLSNSIATTLRMWDRQIPELSKRYRVLRYDTRGHGASDAPAGAYSLDRLGRDVLELLDALGIETIRFCGLSFGGLIGQWLGVQAPERIERLILANTSPFLGPAEQWDQQISAVVAAKDLRPIADSFLRDADMLRTIQLINCPTLVIAGEHDTVTLPEHGKAIADTIPSAQLVTLSTVHLSNVKLPEAVSGRRRLVSRIDPGRIAARLARRWQQRASDGRWPNGSVVRELDPEPCAEPLSAYRRDLDRSSARESS